MNANISNTTTQKGKNVVITGATGMVGSYVLKHLLDDNRVGEVISVGRKKTGLNHKKLKEIEHTDFLDFSGMKQEFSNIDLCIYCLAVYQNQVTKEDYIKITCDYQKAFTDELEKHSPSATFVLFGAAGADPSEQSRMIFAKAKGKAENLANLTSFPKKYIFRPGFIKPTGKRRPSSWDYKLFQPLYNLIFRLSPSLGIKDHDLAKAMVNEGLKAELSSQTFENRDIRKLINL